MAAYLILEIDVTDPEAMAAYRQGTGPLVKQYGGKPFAPAAIPRALEGDAPKCTVGVLEFPSMEAIESFWFSPEYQKLIEMRAGAAKLNVWALNGAA